ncbi:hypothetical protein BYT27DRAFT_7221900 [Phlegmacium glaucopus]|nr:hypothetical protein BYT27DRAFT_7221900 [Phlegmacium glaucopus]
MPETMKFPLLNHTNYPEWSIQMEAILVWADYWDLLAHIGNPNPKVVWESLAKVHHARGFGNCLQLCHHFITATMIEVSDEDIIVILTAGLPHSYTPVIISFDALDPEKLTLDFIINHLLNEEAQQLGSHIKEGNPKSSAIHNNSDGDSDTLESYAM